MKPDLIDALHYLRPIGTRAMDEGEVIDRVRRACDAIEHALEVTEEREGPLSCLKPARVHGWR